MNMKKNRISGRIIKGIGGFYYVRPDGSASLLECKARGIFRHQKIKPMVGDFVEVVENDQDELAIDEIKPRKNEFVRPPVSNVDVALIVFAGENPSPNLLLLDKLLIASEMKAVEPIICITKTDLVDAGELQRIRAIYAKTPYKCFAFDQTDNIALEAIEAEIEGKTAFLAGPSGVGKSTLANRLCEAGAMETGELSQKLNRGKHTTRHVELLDLKAGGYLLDTPGFSSLKLDREIEKEDLRFYFPEFEEGACRFASCLHQSEPGCAVKAQLESGEISPVRYEHYSYLLNEIKNKRSDY
ncbi:ribosome small subunit-dependent GTPase A [Eubacterium sp. 1001713B170207_170306_E7]|uniref:ribosome small subunit-dependent GTPase A n=1 Tax=Eubacterium sp. 1001713B170207_170306_E7 TaxID=2787097 RepID=UPI00189BAD9C|nr:ribosome small subunit-dependent GTPase A [Eubacterium sp. 1001713B170207_170306_E7]